MVLAKIGSEFRYRGKVWRIKGFKPGGVWAVSTDGSNRGIVIPFGEFPG